MPLRRPVAEISEVTNTRRERHTHRWKRSLYVMIRFRDITINFMLPLLVPDQLLGDIKVSDSVYLSANSEHSRWNGIIKCHLYFLLDILTHVLVAMSFQCVAANATVHQLWIRIRRRTRKCSGVYGRTDPEGLSYVWHALPDSVPLRQKVHKQTI